MSGAGDAGAVRVALEEFTDPSCPFAYSAEPIRWKLRWRFGDQLDWTVRMVGLARDAATLEAKGLTAERLGGILRHFDQYGMPLAEVESRAPAGSWDAGRAVVAARERRPGSEDRLLRELRIAGLADAEAIDDPTVIDAAARAAGLDPEELRGWVAEPAIEAAFEGDLDAARHPGLAALALDHKLADVEDDWAGGGPGRRYTCPSYVLRSGGATFEIPGFQPWAAYEAALANLAPALERRPWAEDPLAVLRWAGEPLATQEVAAVLGDADREQTRRQLLESGAVQHTAGSDAFWVAP